MKSGSENLIQSKTGSNRPVRFNIHCKNMARKPLIRCLDEYISLKGERYPAFDLR